VTGKLGLPPHGYVAVATADLDDVLFPWRYALAIPRLFMDDHDDASGVLAQHEVTLRRRPTLDQQIHGLERIGSAPSTSPATTGFTDPRRRRHAMRHTVIAPAR
jgi:hypothetical protein